MGIGNDVEPATKLSHALAHAGDTDAETGFVRLLRTIVGREMQAPAKVDDFESDGGVFLKQANPGGRATGMALNVGEAFLDDAEQGGFDRLGQAGELRAELEASVDAAAFAEPLEVFVERGDETEIIEKRRVEKIGKSADFARHLLGEGTGFFERASSGLIVRMDGLACLSETEIDGQDGLRKAVVELATDAAALFVLELEELRRELMDGALGIFHLGDVGERGDNADHIAMSIELRHSIAKDPKYFARGARMTNAQSAIFDRNARAEDDTNGVFFEGKAVPISREQPDAKIGRGFAGCSPLRDTEHAVSSSVGEFD